MSENINSVRLEIEVFETFEGGNRVARISSFLNSELIEWVDAVYSSEAAKYYDATAVYWYGSTYKIFEEELRYAKNAAPDKHLIQTEAYVDAEVPA